MKRTLLIQSILIIAAIYTLTFCARSSSQLNDDAADGDYAPQALEISECLE